MIAEERVLSAAFTRRNAKQKRDVTLLHDDLNLGTKNLKGASGGFNWLEEGQLELETLAIGHLQINADLTFLKLDQGRLGINLLGKDRQVDMSLGLVPVMSAVNQLLDLLLLYIFTYSDGERKRKKEGIALC